MTWALAAGALIVVLAATVAAFWVAHKSLTPPRVSEDFLGGAGAQVAAAARGAAGTQSATAMPGATGTPGAAGPPGAPAAWGAPGGLASEEVSIGPHRLSGRLLVPSETPRGIVILVHGWGSNASRMTAWFRFLSEAGWTCLSFDARGHGRSPGDRGPTLSEFAQDLECAVRFVEERSDLARLPRFAVGHSMGGAALLLALSREAGEGALGIRGGVVSSAFARIETLTDHVLRTWYLPPAVFRLVVRRVWERRFEGALEAVEPVTTIRKTTVPLLLTHGSRDPIVPESELDRLVRARPEGTEVLRIPGAAHSDLTEFSGMREAVLRFLEKAAPPGPIGSSTPARSSRPV